LHEWVKGGESALAESAGGHTSHLGSHSIHTVAIIRFKHQKMLVLKGKQNVKYKSNCNKPFIVEIQFSTKAERKFEI
jgi:hypothetical protein